MILNFSYEYGQWIKMYLECKPLSNPPCVNPVLSKDTAGGPA